MNNIITLLFTLLAYVSAEGAQIIDWPHKEDGVMELTDHNFDQALENGRKGILIEFYAPYYPGCDELAK
jgi:hypothetical protein